MKKLYIHLGTGKTGTTAIQKFLAQNDDSLRENESIQYVCAYRSRSNHHLLCANYNGNDAKKHPESLHDRVLHLAEEIKASPADNFIISSEYFPGVSDDAIEKHYVDPLRNVADIHTIIYFRRQDEYLESWYAQLLKTGAPGSGAGIDNLYKRLKARGTMDYYAKLNSWSRHIGHDNVHVRPYERHQFRGGDILHDFMSILGVESIDGYTPPGSDPNPSLSRDQLLAIEAMYQAGLGEYVTAALRKPDGNGADESRFRLSPTSRQAIIDDWAEVNAAVANDYLGREDGLMFTGPSPHASDANWRPKDSPSPHYLLQFVKTMLDTERDKLTSRIEALERQSGGTPQT